MTPTQFSRRTQDEQRTGGKPNANYGPGHFWKILWIILGCELLLALSLPRSGVSTVPLLAAYVDAIAAFFPPVRNFDRIAAAPEFVAAYIALTLPLIIPKTYLLFRWLESDYLGTYRHLVLSPLTKYAPPHSIDFLVGGEKSTRTEVGETGTPRTLFWRVAGSLLIVGLSFIWLYGWTEFGSDVPAGRTDLSLRATQDSYIRLAGSPIWMWFEWGCRSLVAALWLAIDASIVRDYYRFGRSLLRGDKK